MRKVKLGEIAEIQAGPFGTQLHKSEYVSSGVPMLNSKNIGYGEIIESSLDFVPTMVCKRLPQYILHEGDILFGRAGTIERHAYVDHNYEGGFQGTNCIRVRCLEKDLALYIFYYLWLRAVKDKIENSAGGSIQSYITTNLLNDIDVQIPDDYEKKTYILQQIDEKILLNQKINDNLQRQLKTLYDYWFTQFDFPDESGRPYRSSGGKMVYNPTLRREIPVGWESVNIREITSITWGQCPDGENILPVLSKGDGVIDYCSGAGDMKGGFLVDCQAKTNDSRRNAHENDILVSVAGKIGDMCFVDHTISLGRAAMAYTVMNTDEIPYVYLTLKSLNKKMMMVSSGSIQKVINNTNVDDFNFAYDKKVIQEFSVFSNPIFKELVRIARENKKLTELRDWLLPLLMNGQATVAD